MTNRVQDVEKDVLLQALNARLGTSSTQLVLSTIGGMDEYPVKDHPWDGSDVHGLTRTLEELPDELRDRATVVYEEQMRQYRQHSFDYRDGRRIR